MHRCPAADCCATSAALPAEPMADANADETVNKVAPGAAAFNVAAAVATQNLVNEKNFLENENSGKGAAGRTTDETADGDSVLGGKGMGEC